MGLDMSFVQIESTWNCVLAPMNRPKCGFWPERIDIFVCFGWTELTEMRVLATCNRPKCEHWQHWRDCCRCWPRKQTKIWVLTRSTARKCGFGTNGIRKPSQPGEYVTWIADCFFKLLYMHKQDRNQKTLVSGVLVNPLPIDSP